MLAQWISDLAAHPSKLPGIALGARLLRRVRLAVSDPLVTCEVGGFLLELPLSHELPRYQAAFPGYGSNIARLARAIASKYPDAGVIDVGANVGDSAALIRSTCSLPVLCVDGAPVFFDILERNAARIPGVHLHRAFVGRADDSVNGRFESARGTGRIVADADRRVHTETLESVLVRHPEFPAPRLLKIDTDGFDCAILEANLPLLVRLQPVLFFEYDPALLGEEFAPLPFFARLSAAGYAFALVYDNVGDLMVCTPLSQTTVLEDVHRYFCGRRSERYADLAIFHASDQRLAEGFRREELAHFTRSRG